MDRSRREFLRSALAGSAAVSLAGPTPAFLARAAGAAGRAGREKDTVLVVLQLSGGNDGLNTVVPFEDDAYGRARRTLRLTGREVHRIGDGLGFHPRMPGFARLLKEGRLAVVQGVGYPNSDRSHPGAMRNWHTARPDRPQCPTGWVGRAVDSAGADLAGMFVGPIATPFALTAERAVVPSVRTGRELTFRRAPAGPVEPIAAGDENPLAAHVRRAAAGAGRLSRRVRAALVAAEGSGPYGDEGLAADLRTVAALIRADVGVRIFFTELGGGGIGGFDNHAVQRDNHAALLARLSGAVTAFADDLARDGLLDRVLLMTFSEFGRTLTENGRKGTGHGAAAPMFLVGGKVRGGLIGPHPSLDDLDKDAPRHHTDFRDVYATVLGDWLGLDAAAILGRRGRRLPLLEG